MKNFAIIDDFDDKRVVPSKWLSDALDSVWWPPFEDGDKIGKAIIDLLDPDKNTWESYPIKRFIKYKDDYVNAVSELKYIDKVSDASDSEKLKRTRSARNKKKIPDDFLLGESRKVKKKKEDSINKLIPNDDGSSTENEVGDKGKDSDSEPENYPVAPPTLVENNINKVSAPDNSSTPKTSKTFSKNSLAASPLEDLENLCENNESIDDERSDDKPRKPKLLITKDVQNWTPKKTEEAILTIYTLQKKTLTGIHALMKKFEALELKVDRLGKTGIKHASASDNIVLDMSLQQTLSKMFPINDDNTLDAVENKLKTERRFFDNVVMYMKSKGGNSTHDLIYNILPTILTNNVAATFSYYGQKHKGVFSKLALCSCIYQSVRLLFPTATDDEKKKSIKQWLDASNTRLIRAQTRAPKRMAFEPIIPPEELENNEP